MSPSRRAVCLALGLVLLAGCDDEDTNLPFTVVAQPASPVTGQTTIFYTLTTDGSQAKVAVDVSRDDGFTFVKATEVAGASNPILQTGVPEGTSASDSKRGTSAR